MPPRAAYNPSRGRYADAIDLHTDLEPLAFLLGTWSGEGVGDYSTISPFTYTETIEITQSGRPFFEYRQRTRDGATGAPLHTESGYFRAAGPGTAELVLSMPSGIAEVHSGSVVGSRLALRTVAVARTPTAKEVTDVERIFEVDGTELRYTLLMSAVGQPHQIHLEATLRRR